jgi:hypothetical protein
MHRRLNALDGICRRKKQINMDHMAQDPRERSEAIRVLEEYCVQVCGFDGIFSTGSPVS